MGICGALRKSKMPIRMNLPFISWRTSSQSRLDCRSGSMRDFLPAPGGKTSPPSPRSSPDRTGIPSLRFDIPPTSAIRAARLPITWEGP